MAAAASNEFKLIGPCDTEEYNPSAVTFSCRLAPEISAVNMEIRWFKETDCVCVYKNRQVTEGRGYEGRVNLFTRELKRGNVSLQLRDCKWSDRGDYLCQVTDGDRTEMITVEMNSEKKWRPSSVSRREEADPPLREEVWVCQIQREWTEDERLEMMKSVLQTEYKIDDETLYSGFKTKNRKLEETEEELKNTKMELDSVSKSLQYKDKQLDDFKGQIENKDTEVKNREKIIEEKDAQLNDTYTTLEKTTKDLQEKERVLHERDQQLILKETQIQETQIQVEEMEKRLVEKDEDLNDQNEQLKVLKEQLEMNEKSISERDAVLMETNKKLHNATEQIEEKNTQLENMNNTLSEKETQLKNTDKELATSKNKLETLGQELKDLKRHQETELEEKNKQLEEKETQLLKRDKQLQEKERLLNENTQRLQLKEKTLEEKDMLLTKMKEECEKSKRALEENQKQMKDNETKLENMVKELETSKNELMEKDKQLQERESRIEEKTKWLQEQTDPESSAPIRRRNSMDVLPPLMGGEFTPHSPVSVPVAELRLVLLGGTGSGKSAVGNIILGREERNQAAISTATSTQQSESTQGEVAGRKVTVVDTPDWFSPGLSLEKLRQDVELCVHLTAPGPHAFLLLIPVKQPTGEQKGILEKIEEIFGERFWRNTMIIFSVTDELQKKNIEEFIQSGVQEVQRLVEKCGNRFHCLNIKESGDGSQVSDFLEKIEKMVEENREKFYSSEIYLETESQIRAMETKILKEIEEKRMEGEKDMKEKIEKEVQESLRKIEGVIQEHEGDIRQLNDRTTELERKVKEERDEEKKKELEMELHREVERRTEMEGKVTRLKEKRERERREMEEKHKQEMEVIREECAGEMRMVLMKTIQPELQRYILASKTKTEEECSRQMEIKHRELETLKQKVSELTEILRLREEVYQTTVMSLTYQNQHPV